MTKIGLTISPTLNRLKIPGNFQEGLHQEFYFPCNQLKTKFNPLESIKDRGEKGRAFWVGLMEYGRMIFRDHTDKRQEIFTLFPYEEDFLR